MVLPCGANELMRRKRKSRNRLDLAALPEAHMFAGDASGS